MSGNHCHVKKPKESYQETLTGLPGYGICNICMFLIQRLLLRLLRCAEDAFAKYGLHGTDSSLSLAQHKPQACSLSSDLASEDLAIYTVWLT